MAKTMFVSEMKRETKHETIKLTSHKRHEFGDPMAKPQPKRQEHSIGSSHHRKMKNE